MGCQCHTVPDPIVSTNLFSNIQIFNVKKWSVEPTPWSPLVWLKTDRHVSNGGKIRPLKNYLRILGFLYLFEARKGQALVCLTQKSFPYRETFLCHYMPERRSTYLRPLLIHLVKPSFFSFHVVHNAKTIRKTVVTTIKTAVPIMLISLRNHGVGSTDHFWSFCITHRSWPPVHFHRFNCFQMRRQRYELILEHPNFQRRKTGSWGQETLCQ